MSTGNLLAVGMGLRERFPKARIVFIADNDPSGIEKATEAARATGGLIAIPPKEGEDANDLYVREGAEAVKAVIDAARAMEPEAEAEQLRDEEKPVIYVDEGDLPTVGKAIWKAITAANERNPSLFRRGGRPVRIVEDDDGKKIFEELL